jgi:hypothetical protein
MLIGHRMFAFEIRLREKKEEKRKPFWESFSKLNHAVMTSPPIRANQRLLLLSNTSSSRLC